MTIAFLLFFITAVSASTSNGAELNIQRDSTGILEKELSAMVKNDFSELNIPGAIIGVWMGDNAPYIAALGYSDLKMKVPMNIDDKVRIGSITKTFTGTVLLQLVEEGKLSLDDKLSKFFPGFQNGDNISIEMLGNMTSGIYNYSDDDIWEKDFEANMKLVYTPQQLIAIAEKHSPYFAPGTSIHYSNTNTILLGLIIEKLTGNSIESEIQKRILEPLGMSNTSFATNSAFPDPHAKGYFYFDSSKTEPTDVTEIDPGWAWSAGAMISNLMDMHRYAKVLATGGLLKQNIQQERLKWISFPPITSGPYKGRTMRYGFAIADFDGALGHNGGIPGFNSYMGYIPDKDATVIVFVNMQETKAGISPADYIGAMIVEKIKGM